MIDFDALALKRPEVVYDLPAGGRRLIQRATGYRHTFNAGVETLHNDELTGERPGRVVRGRRRTDQETRHARRCRAFRLCRHRPHAVDRSDSG